MTIKLVIFDYDDTISVPYYVRMNFNSKENGEVWKNAVSEIFSFLEERGITIGVLTSGLYEREYMNVDWWFPSSVSTLKYWINRKIMDKKIRDDFCKCNNYVDPINFMTWMDSFEHIEHYNEIKKGFQEWLKKEKIEDFDYHDYRYKKLYSLVYLSEQEGLSRDEILFIDDMRDNINLAKKAGFNTILCDRLDDILFIKEKIGVNSL